MKFSQEPRIDLLAYRREEQLEQSENLRHVAIAALLAVILLGGMGAAWWLQKIQVAKLQSMNMQWQQKIDQMSNTVADTVKKTNTKSQDSRQAILSELEASTQMKSKLLREIYQLSIPNITIGKLEIKDNNELTVSAYCTSHANFIKFLGQLRELDFIKEVKKISSKYNEKTGEVNFNLTMEWEADK